MFSLRTREDKDVIKVNNTKNVKKVSKSVLNEGLKSSRHIHEFIRGNCHDHDRTYPYSAYPNLSTPIPSHQNHP